MERQTRKKEKKKLHDILCGIKYIYVTEKENTFRQINISFANRLFSDWNIFSISWKIRWQ